MNSSLIFGDANIVVSATGFNVMGSLLAGSQTCRFVIIFATSVIAVLIVTQIEKQDHHHSVRQARRAALAR